MSIFIFRLALGLLLFAVLLAVSVSDLRRRIIPDRYHLAVLAVGVALLCFSFADGEAPSLLSRGLGAIAISLPMLVCIILNPRSFGGGDMKLFFAGGFLLGAGAIVEAAAVAFVLGGLYALAVLLVTSLSRKIRRRRTIAFGPFIAIGIMGVYFTDMLQF
jgi:prepilin signal peptidase PulO-like enzyme (type II secretory pathway)